MKSMHLSGLSQKPMLIEQDVPRPNPKRGEVLVRVHAAGVTPAEIVWYPTSHTKTGGTRSEPVPSHEFSGEIAEIGEGVTRLSAGQQVYGMNDWFEDGTLAEYCITQPDWIAPKPSRLTHAESASVPIGALTAWQGLFDRAKLLPGERVLVQGGAGAVGLFAVQFARSRGAYVIATASEHNLDFVKNLGADEVLDYKAAPFESKVRDLDVVFDTVGGETLRRSWNVLKPNGRLVTVAGDSESSSDERVKQAFFIVEPRRDQLVEIAKLLDSGKLRTVVDTVLPLSRASDAYTGSLHRTGRGKIVISVAASVEENAHGISPR
jgi:NADPH:quinone reductase-like Zn-dependent oxidoreductase